MELNLLQKEFLETISSIQERCVQIALCQNNSDISLEDKFYDITAQVIIDIMTVLDGYSNDKIGRLKIYSEKTGGSLKDSPYIELHDIVCDYLKGAD